MSCDEKDNVVTFGCRLNAYESECIRNISDNCLQQKPIIINTCAVTNEAERQVMQFIRKSKKEFPDKEIFVVGCAVDIDPEKYINMNGVTKVIGNSHKLKKSSYISDSEIIVGPSNSNDDAMLSRFVGKTRAFLKVQDGCNHSCTFCATTKARGSSVSIPISKIVSQAKQMFENGHKEIVLTGVDMSDYGSDSTGDTLLNMIRSILDEVKGLPRLRLSSLDVAEISDELLNFICCNDRVMPHIHLSLQSGNDMILKRMKRRHNCAQVKDFAQKIMLMNPDVVLGADIIAGFPTETEDMFLDTINMIKDCNITHLHVFAYSPREGTAASRMPQVDPAIRKDRARKLRELSANIMHSFMVSQIGKKVSVLFESDNSGYAENFCFVKSLSKFQRSAIGEIEIVGIRDNALIGRAV